MKRRLLLAAAAAGATLLLSSATAYASQASSGFVEITGTKRGRGIPQGYNLHVKYSLDAINPPGDAVLVYAEPSHVLLLQHSFRDAEAGASSRALHALAQGASNGSAFSYDLLLSYDPAILRDSGVSVTLISKGREWLIAAGRVNSTEFNFTTHFDVVSNSEGSVEAITGVEHCCGGGGTCGRMCVTCSGAYFTCDRINCTIECGWL